MKTKKVTLKEFRKVILDILVEERQLMENLEVKKNKVINILKGKSIGLSHDDAKKLVDDNEDMFNDNKKSERNIAVELKQKHKGS